MLLLLRRTWPRARALLRIVRQRGIGLVHTNIRVGHDREGVLAAWMAGVPCVSHVRDFEELNWFDRRLADRVDAFVYISEAVRAHHLLSGVSRNKGRVVYNAVDSAAFGSDLDVREERSRLGLADDDLAVGMVGRLERWKGQDVFLRALATVQDAVVRAKGVVIGDPVPYDLEYRDLLHAMCDELELGDRVIFHRFRQNVATTMAALDLVVLASTSPEPFGRVLIEAMAAGRPVVATDSGAVREIVTPGKHGLLVPPGDAQALAAAIVRVLTHGDEAIAMGQNGKERVAQQFDVQRYVENIQDVYHNVLT
jgi:glycosyltransferase involved in cell wall biosynthesis